MSRAWRIFKQHLSNFTSFSDCLSRAWKIEKENLKYRIEKAVLEVLAITYAQVDMSTSNAFKPSAEAMALYYNSNAYMGD